MLEADKKALERDLAQQMASLQVCTARVQAYGVRARAARRSRAPCEAAPAPRVRCNLALTSAMLVGFGFTGLGLFRSTELETNYNVLRCSHLTLGFDFSREDPISNSECRRTIFAAVVDVCWAASCALGLTWNLLSLFIATITSITGPGMALRGPEGSLGVALAHMELQNKRALRFFGRGLVAFSFSVISFGLQARARVALSPRCLTGDCPPARGPDGTHPRGARQACAVLGLFKGVIIGCVGVFTVYNLQLCKPPRAGACQPRVGHAPQALARSRAAEIGNRSAEIGARTLRLRAVHAAASARSRTPTPSHPL
eukprot:2099673-Prymnesium_polylepis.1